MKIQQVLVESTTLLAKDKELISKLEKQRNQQLSLNIVKESYTVLNSSLKNHVNDLRTENIQFKSLLKNLTAIKFVIIYEHYVFI